MPVLVPKKSNIGRVLLQIQDPDSICEAAGVKEQSDNQHNVKCNKGLL